LAALRLGKKLKIIRCTNNISKIIPVVFGHMKVCSTIRVLMMVEEKLPKWLVDIGYVAKIKSGNK
jgi:hypothetical protein